jgi:hypothetical protein
MNTYLQFIPTVSAICHDDTTPDSASSPDKALPVDAESANIKLIEQNKSLAAKVSGYEAEVGQMQQAGKITAADRAELEERMSKSQAELRTAQELGKKQLEKVSGKHQEEIAATKAEANQWRDRYINDFQRRTLLEAATEHKPFNSDQVLDILLPRSEVIEDEPGTGRFSVKVTFPNTDPEGEPFVLSPADAVKNMAESDRHANLFVSPGSAGTFRKPGSGGEGPSLVDAAKDGDIETYKKLRKK